MANEISRNVYVGETNKLKGRANYNVWRLKMRALLMQEGYGT
jgi:hypothetical protein